MASRSTDPRPKATPRRTQGAQKPTTFKGNVPFDESDFAVHHFLSAKKTARTLHASGFHPWALQWERYASRDPRWWRCPDAAASGALQPENSFDLLFADQLDKLNKKGLTKDERYQGCSMAN